MTSITVVTDARGRRRSTESRSGRGVGTDTPPAARPGRDSDLKNGATRTTRVPGRTAYG
jgi:hypothetical protein